MTARAAPVRGIPTLLVLGLLLGCGSSVDNTQYALSHAVVGKEVTESGKVLDIPREGVTEVDVNSSIILQMNEPAIRNAVTGTAKADPQRTQKLTDRMRQLEELLAKQLKVVELLGVIAKDPAPTKKELEELGKLEEAVSAGVSTYAEAQKHDVDKLYSTSGNAKVIAYLQGELEKTKRDHEALVSRLDTFAWRMRASLRGGQRSQPIHLANYDNLEPGEVDIRNKLIPVIDEGVKAEMAQAEALARRAKDLDAFTKLLAEEARRRVEALIAHLQASLEQLAQRIRNLESVASTHAAAQELLTEVKGTVSAAKTAGTECKTALDALRAIPKDVSVASLVSIAFASTKGCGEALAALATSAGRTRAAAEKLAANADVKALAEQVKGEVTAMARVTFDLETLREVLKRSEPQLAAAAWAADSAYTDHSVAALVDSQLDLTTTNRQLGDHVVYQGMIRDTRADATVVEGPRRSLKVVQNGPQIDVSASLLFLQPMDIADNEDDFRAAPALTGSFHIRCGRSSGEAAPTGTCAAWNFFNFGLGAHVATLTLGEVSTDPATGATRAESVETPHIALGAVGLLFGDLLQGGAGYDFQAARSYWFVGVGIQTLTDLGFTFEL